MTADTWERPKGKVSLHGLGFLQVQLQGNLRLHVWHPELPVRSCSEHSSIHDHRFGFESTVVRGTQINHVFAASTISAAHLQAYWLYRHDGPRSKFGNRPWLQELAAVYMHHVYTETVKAGETYKMPPFVFHRTEPGGDGRVATLMCKTSEGEVGARSSCRVGVKPDVDFDRHQLDEDEMWDVVRNVMGEA